MRIIAGRWRGRRIAAPPGHAVRPTGERTREAWMSRLHAELPLARVLDLYAGSGALGLEALSRGAAFCDFVESAERSVRVIRANAEALGALPCMAVHREDALRFVARLPERAYDIVMADPPYHLGLAALLVQAWHDTPFAHILTVEHHADEALPDGGIVRRYGTSAVTLYRAPLPGGDGAGTAVGPAPTRA
ncbi:MAG: RsmD family RNA methyltransferase [Gemmatimonadaceae bacterium]|nr:RsmD family RNA methyltransferase [Gemmatimonadaceae bacterium]